MPSFCRHNRLVQNCPICSREQAVEMRPVVSSATPKASEARPSERRAGAGAGTGGSAATRTRSAARSGAGARGGVKVRRLARGADDGFASPLLPGLRSSVDADRLAAEIAFAVLRLERLAADPPGLYAELANPSLDVEERTWLAFQIAYLGPLEEADPFAAIRERRTSWASGEVPSLATVRTGPRGAHAASRGGRTLEAYRAWALRAGSQAEAFTGERAWSPERRFARVFERMALPGLHRDARFDLLVTLGRTGVYELRADTLRFGGENETTIAAKRALGIGDPMLLERRAAELAAAVGVPLESLDLALANWGGGHRIGLGLDPAQEGDPDVLERIRAALGLSR